MEQNMDDGSLVLESFHSEIVVESDDQIDDNDDDDQSHLLQENNERTTNRRKLYRDGNERVRTRLVYNILPSKGSKCSCCFSWKSILCFLLILICVGTFLFFATQSEVTIESNGGHSPNIDYMDFKQPENMITNKEILEDNFMFNLTSKTDVMVFLHIQKTGGTTFGKHLVEDIDLARPCECHRKTRKRRKFHCDCFRPGTKDSNWLFSRYSTGWKCGLHPDWTELTSCVDDYMSFVETGVKDRRYFYITFLRHPVDRYLSEWKHVYRGATWKTAELKCGGVTWGDVLPTCYGDEEDDDWSGVSLSDFMDCPHNLATNRQTRMLADLELVNCYNTTVMDRDKRDKIMLESAKANLVNMAYFGLTELQEMSQYMFEETFNLRFKTDFDQLSQSDTHSGHSMDKLEDGVIDRIKNLNHLDLELYKFAKQLLEERFEAMKEGDESFEEHIDEVKKEKEFSWSDIEDENYDAV